MIWVLPGKRSTKESATQRLSHGSMPHRRQSPAFQMARYAPRMPYSSADIFDLHRLLIYADAAVIEYHFLALGESPFIHTYFSFVDSHSRHRAHTMLPSYDGYRIERELPYQLSFFVIHHPTPSPALLDAVAFATDAMLC